MAGLAVERLQPATLGVDVAASPEYVDARRAPQSDNLLPGRDGKLVMRGPMTTHFQVDGRPAPDQFAAGAMTFDNRIMVAQGDLTHVAHVDPDTLVVTPVVAATDAVPGRSYTRHGPNVFAVNTSSVASVGRLLRWDGTAVAPTRLTTAAPRAPLAVRSHLSRLFCLGGTVPGTTTPALPTSLFWTDADTTTVAFGDTLAQWQDDVSGVVNQIVLDGETSNPGVALAGLGANLLILRKRTLMLLTGSGASSFAVRSVAAVGCVDPASVVEANDAVYFMSPEGYMRFDGAAIENVSRRVFPAMARAAQPTQTIPPWSATLIAWSAARLGSEHLILAGGNTTFGSLAGFVLHIPTGSWSRLSVSTVLDDYAFGSPKGLPAFAGRTADYPFLWIGKRLFFADKVAEPITGFGDLGVDGNATLGRRGVPATYATRVTRLATPVALAQLNRVFVDYSFHANGGSAGEQGWTVELHDGEGTLISSLGQVPMAANGSRQRAVFEVFKEVREVQVVVRWDGTTETSGSGPGAKNSNPEIYDVWVEYQPARQR